MNATVGNSYKLKRTSDNEEFDAHLNKEDAHSVLIINIETKARAWVKKDDFDNQYEVLSELPGVKHSEEAPQN
mgnify:CR=1 FL=1